MHQFFTPCVTHALSISSSLIYPPSNNWQEVQVLKLLLIQFSPTSCYFLPLIFFLTSSQVPIVKHLHPVIVSLTWTKFHSHIKQEAKSQFCQSPVPIQFSNSDYFDNSIISLSLTRQALYTSRQLHKFQAWKKTKVTGNSICA